MKTKIPPQNIEAEKAILGAIMLDKEAINKATTYLQPEMFYQKAHETIYQAMLTLNSKNQPIDIITVVQELTRMKKIEEVGGPYYVTTLTNSVISSSHIENHSRQILEKHLKREIIRLGANLYKNGYDESTDPFELIEDAEKGVMILSTSLNTKDFISIDEIIINIAKELEEKRNRNSYITGVNTGYPELNRTTCGWQPTDLVILAARPKCGKTAFALNLAKNAVEGGDGVGFFSLEMSSPQLLKRVLANKSSIYLQSLRDARLDDGQMVHLYESGFRQLAGQPFFIDDTPGLSITEFRSKARRMVAKHGVKIIFVDYLQLMTPDKSKKNQNREQEVSNIARQLKITAKELNVPVIALSQLSREVEKRGSSVPQLSDLRESGSLEQDADMVCFLYKPSEADAMNDANLQNRIYFRIAAYRNGEPKTIEFDFAGEYQRFIEKGVETKVVPLPSTFRKLNDSDGFPGLSRASNYEDPF